MTINIAGKVIHGYHLGKILGFPTANLDRRDYVKKNLNVKFGVYSGFAVLPSGEKYRSGIVIGPKDSHNLPKIEAHLLRFKGNLYGKKLTISLQKYLRPFRKFNNVKELKKRIKKDLAIISRRNYEKEKF